MHDHPRPEIRPPQEDSFDVGKMLGTLWRGKLIIATCAALAVLAGGYYAYVAATPVYRSLSVLMLNTREERVVDLEGVIGGLTSDASTLNTEVEVLKSRELLGQVVDRLDLMADPEFNPELAEASTLDQLRGWVRRLFRGAPAIETLEGMALERRNRDTVITALSQHTFVANLPKSLVFRITVDSTSGTKSARIADALAEAYIEDQVAQKFEATEQATVWLTTRLAELQISLETAENAVKAFRTDTELVSFEALQSLEVQLKTLRDRIRDTEVSTGTIAAELAAHDAAATDEARAAVTGDAVLQGLLPRLARSAADRNTFDQRFATLRARVAAELQRNEAQLASLRASSEALTGQIARQSADLITLQQLQREAEASRLLYEYFLNRLKETSAQQGVQQADSRILSRAVVPVFPSAPDKSTILLVSAFLGMLLGSAIVFVRELRNTNFRASEQLEAATGYTVLGQIPLIPVRRRDRAIAYLTEKPASAQAEAVRDLRTSVLLSNLDNPPQVLMVCSSQMGEGKTTVSFALAQNIAGMGKRTLLVEGDMRRRVFSQYIDTGASPGLVAVLTQDKTLDEVILQDTLLGADVLPAGETRANPADLLSSQRFAQVLETLRGHYDQIIIDTPPVLVVPDARILAHLVDATLLVVKWDATSSNQVAASLHAFENVGHRVSGFVLNQISPSGMRRYGYGNAYGPYGGDGKKYYQT